MRKADSITHKADPRGQVFRIFTQANADAMDLRPRRYYSAEMPIKLVAKFCSVAAIIAVAIFALGPAHWQPRTGIGWGFDHFAGYFAITLMCCVAWPRPLLVGAALMVGSAALEGLQAFTPDRSANVLAALCGSGGALAAAVLAALFIRVRRAGAG